MEIPARPSCLQFMRLPIKNDVDDPVTIISSKLHTRNRNPKNHTPIQTNS